MMEFVKPGRLAPQRILFLGLGGSAAQEVAGTFRPMVITNGKFRKGLYHCIYIYNIYIYIYILYIYKLELIPQPTSGPNYMGIFEDAFIYTFVSICFFPSWPSFRWLLPELPLQPMSGLHHPHSGEQSHCGGRCPGLLRLRRWDMWDGQIGELREDLQEDVS